MLMCDLRFMINLFIIIMDKNIFVYLVIFSSLVILSVCWEFNNPYALHPVNTVKMDSINQIINHYDYSSSATFKQRFYILDDYYAFNGPVYLYICGEAQCRGISNSSWTAKIAQQTQGIIFALQHRFYGKSLPFGNESFTLQNLKYLNSEQALRDLAYFINYIQTNRLYGVNKVNPWITVGGSYAGAMSSWFRSKYPHLTIGALGSSGVVLAVENFKDFDEQIYQSALKSGLGCVNAIIDVNKYVEDIINSDKRLQFQTIFKAQKLTSKQFLFYWADVIVFQFQYSRRVQFCEAISGKSTQEIYNVVKAQALAISPYDYGALYLKNVTFAAEVGNGARSWIYQSCTQFSYFQTYSNHPMRSLQLDLNFYKQWCSNIFGEGVWPLVQKVNNQFGGLKLIADNLFMTNGDEDPWRWASLQTDSNKIISRVIVCPNCGHCVDLKGPSDSDSDNLKQVHQEQRKTIWKWLNQYYKNINIDKIISS